MELLKYLVASVIMFLLFSFDTKAPVKGNRQQVTATDGCEQQLSELRNAVRILQAENDSLTAVARPCHDCMNKCGFNHSRR